MIEGQLIFQNAGARFGQLETPAKNGDVIYTTTFTDPTTGVSVSVLWQAHTARDFFEKALEAMTGVVGVPKPKLEIARTIPAAEAKGRAL